MTRHAAQPPSYLPERPSLEERRARFVYDAARIHALAIYAPVVPLPWYDRSLAFREQFVEAVNRQCAGEGSQDPKALHDQWLQKYREMGWTYGPEYDCEAKTHPDMVPYEDLDPRERIKDEVFRRLCEIARDCFPEAP